MSRSLDRDAVALVLVGAMALALTSVRWVEPSSWIFVDIDVFLRGGAAVRSGADLYAAPSGVLPFTYPPVAALLFAPLSLVNALAVKWLWTATSLAAYLVVALVTARAAAPNGPRSRRWAQAAVMVALAGALEPVTRTFVLGQINLILAALVLLDLFVVPARYRGVLIGLAAAVKLTPAYFAIHLLVTRDWRSFARFMGAFLGSAALAWVILPSASRRYWGGGVLNLDKFGGYALLPMDQSLRACLVRLGPGWAAPQVLLPLTAGVAALSIVAAVRLVRRRQPLAAVTCLAAGSLLVSPISWTHHWVWVVPALAVMARRGWYAAVVVTVGEMFLPPMWAADATARIPVVHQVCTDAFALSAVVYLLAMTVRPGRAERSSEVPDRSREKAGESAAQQRVPGIHADQSPAPVS